MSDEIEASKTEWKKYLFALGMPRHISQEIMNELDCTVNERKLTSMELYKTMTAKAENNTPSKNNAKDLAHEEDRELLEHLIGLPFKNRAAVILYHFFGLHEADVLKILDKTNEKTFLEVSEKMLADGLKERIGFVMGSSELHRLLRFVKQDIDKIDWSEEEYPVQMKSSNTSNAAVKKDKRFFKQPLFVAGGVFLFLAGLMMMMTMNEGTVPDPVEASTLEEDLGNLDDAIDGEIELVVEATGLTREDLESVRFINQMIASRASFHERGDSVETDEEIDKLQADIEEFMVDISQQFQTPMERLLSSDGSGDTENFVEQIFISDALLYEFIQRSDGMADIYAKKLIGLEPELASIKAEEIETHAYSEDAKSLIKKIEENGFQLTINKEDQSLQVSPGGGEFEANAEVILTANYIQLLDEIPSFPYVKDGHTDYSFDKIADKLMETEHVLNGLEYGTALSGQFLLEHVKLLNYFISGTAEHPIYEGGKLREDVKTAWEKTANTFYPLSNTARYVKGVYLEHEKNNFEQPDKLFNRLTLAPVAYNMRSNIKIYPLNERLFERYTMFSAFEDEKDIQILNAAEITKLYLNALLLGDKETAYNLLSKSENHPAEEDWMTMDWSEGTEMEIEDIISVQLSSVQSGWNGEQSRVAIETEFTDGSKRKFNLKEENGVWKVLFEERHLGGDWGF